MFKRSLSALAVLLITVPTMSFAAEAEADKAVSAELKDYGLYERAEGYETINVAASPSGKKTLSSATFTSTTYEVPATTGVCFGFKYVLNTEIKGETLLLVKRTTTPGISDPQAQGEPSLEFETELGKVMSGQERHVGYCFDEEWEAAEGKWTIELIHEETTLLFEVFTVAGP